MSVLLWLLGGAALAALILALIAAGALESVSSRTGRDGRSRRVVWIGGDPRVEESRHRELFRQVRRSHAQRIEKARQRVELESPGDRRRRTRRSRRT